MPKRTLLKNNFYHIYNRGCNKQQIFFHPNDYERFLDNIPRYKEKYPHIQIPYYCLLPNHFHLIIIEPEINSESGPLPSNPGFSLDDYLQNPGSNDTQKPIPSHISEFMNRLQQAYARFFNVKYGDEIKANLKGPVFEGRFKDKIILDEVYLNNLIHYIETNAVKHEIVKTPEEWLFSSYDPKQKNKQILEDTFDPGFL